MTEADPLENLRAVRAEMAAAARLAARDPAAVALTVVSKTVEPSRLLPLLAAGERQFGENRVQEAAGKWPALRAAYPDLRLHLIGSLQTNKVADAVRLFDVIEVVDRPRLATALAAALIGDEALPGARTQSLLVQVNTGAEAQKGGIAPGEAPEFVRWCRDDLHLPVHGLMAIPPHDDPPAPHFALLHQLAQDLGLPMLSMGMSGDYREAICLGSTAVRVGSAIFGARG